MTTETPREQRVTTVAGPVEPKAVDELDDLLSQLSITVHSAPTASIKRILARTRKSKVRRVVKERVAKLRSQLPTRSHVDEIHTNRRGVMMERAKRLQNLVDEQALADGGVGADKMIGTRYEGATELVKVGAQDDSAMVGLEFETIDEVMIGSDVEAEMDESPDSDDDSRVVDGDSMDLEEDGPGDSMDLEDDGPLVRRRQTGNLGIKAPKFESVQDRFKRAKAGSGFREAFVVAVSSNKIVSGSVGASNPPIQQHSAPVPTSVNNHAAPVSQGAVRNPIPANSAADLREARLGKRPEAKAAPSQVADPSQASGVPVSTLPPKSSSEESASDNGGTPDSTQTTTTPASTLPSSVSSTPPDSPLPSKTLSSGPPKVPTAKKVLRTEPAKRKVKRDPEPSSAPQPETDSPSQSSKRVQQKRPGDAESDQEVVPLNEIADKTLTGTLTAPKAASLSSKDTNISFAMYILLLGRTKG